jgi:hypothetical protein
MVQLGEDEAANFEQLRRFEPKSYLLDGKRCQVELRSYPSTKIDDKVVRAAKQTVVPGSIYSHKTLANEYDISVWYAQDGKIAKTPSAVAATTPRRVSFNQIIRAIAFATFAYCLRDKWIEGGRQIIATKVSGWLARIVADSQAMNNHETISNDVWCPIDDDSIVESLLHFTCHTFGDTEPHMRVRTYYDARDKLARNPDAKIPGWPTIENELGSEYMHALRTVFTPGSDVSVLTKMAERYIYDETDNVYIDRQRHAKGGIFTHAGEELMTRHKSDTIRIGGKSKDAFKVFEASSLRKRVDHRDMYPEYDMGGIYRFSPVGDMLSDDDSDDAALTVFNTWRGWPVGPTTSPDQELLNTCEQYLNRLLGYMTCDNEHQIKWIKDWVAWTFQNPARKQQIALVCVGEQGVGKSFFGDQFMSSLMGRLWGQASSKVMEGVFSVEPFIDKMFTFIDEAKFNGEGSTEEIKKIVRNVNVGGAEKFGHARTYRIFSRVYFASNRYDINAGQSGVVDRALFYVKAYNREHKNMSEMQFRSWAETLKPWFQEFYDLLQRRDVREHFVYYFMNLPVDIREIESIKYSSSNDEQIVNANMGWARRVAKFMLEDGRIYEDMAIEYPFTLNDLNRRVAEVSKEMGLKNVQGARVLAEFADAGLTERIIDGGKAVYRFKYRWGDIMDQFSAATGVTMNPHFEVTGEDRGVNEAKLADRLRWRGSKAQF